MIRYKEYLSWYGNKLVEERSPMYMAIMTVGVVAALGISLTLLTKCQEPRTVYTSHITEQQHTLAGVFKNNGSKQPLEMAIAVSKTKRPKLMTAIAIVESNGNPTAVGDSGASKGAFQVQAKHWGAVPTTALEQATQAERILDELIVANRGRLRQALAEYNGGTKPPKQSYRYADRVITITRKIKV